MDAAPTAKIAAALAAFQAEMPVVGKHKTASMGTYSYKYADLGDVSKAALPVLTKHGLAFASCPRLTESGHYELLGRLLHSSGETIEGALPLKGNTAQDFGSALTYMRRYLFGCLTGLVTDDDDDGRLASAAKTSRQQTPKTRDGAGARREGSAPAPSSDETGEQVTGPQLKKIGAAMSQRGMTERVAALEFVSSVIGRPIESRNDLTKKEASLLIDELETGQGDEPPEPFPPMTEPGGSDPWQAG